MDRCRQWIIGYSRRCGSNRRRFDQRRYARALCRSSRRQWTRRHQRERPPPWLRSEPYRPGVDPAILRPLAAARRWAETGGAGLLPATHQVRNVVTIASGPVSAVGSDHRCSGLLQRCHRRLRRRNCRPAFDVVRLKVARRRDRRNPVARPKQPPRPQGEYRWPSRSIRYNPESADPQRWTAILPASSTALRDRRRASLRLPAPPPALPQ